MFPQKIPGWISCACTTISSVNFAVGINRVTSCLAGRYNVCLKLSSIGIAISCWLIVKINNHGSKSILHLYLVRKSLPMIPSVGIGKLLSTIWNFCSNSVFCILMCVCMVPCDCVLSCPIPEMMHFSLGK